MITLATFPPHTQDAKFMEEHLIMDSIIGTHGWRIKTIRFDRIEFIYYIVECASDD